MPRKKAVAPAPKKTSSQKKKKGRPSGFRNFMDQHGKMLVFIVAFAVIGGFATYFASAATGKTTGILVGKGNKCLDNLDGKAVNGNKVSLWTCDQTQAQQWVIEGDAIKNNGYCLDVKGASKQAKTIVQMYKCNGTVAQKWSVKANNTIVNPNSGLCLDVQNGKTADGTPIWMWPCNGTDAQKWVIKGTTTPPTTPTDPGPSNPTPNNPSGQALPKGDLTGWKQIFADDFTGTVPVGAFSDCNHNVDTPQAYCGGLKNYGDYYTNWWAYPSGWPDTALSCKKGLVGCPDKSIKPPVGGQYQPEKAMSVANGVMKVQMSRPSSGDNIVAAPVARKCMDRQYGRYVERFKVTNPIDGFKSAHLFYQDGYEMDFPESDNYSQTINAFTHPSEENFSTNAKWNEWHTSAIEWTSGSVKYYLDGKLIGTAKKSIPKIKMSWILQNESSILGPYAKVGASTAIETDWVTCYAPM